MIDDITFLGLNQDDAIEVLKSQDPYPTDVEFGYRSVVEDQDVGFYIREDGVLELHAGEARIILDAATGTVAILGTNLVMQGTSLEQDVESVSWQSQPMDPAWKDTLNPVILSELAKTGKFFLLTTPVVNDGDITTPLSEALKEQPIFLPPQNFPDLYDTLKSVVKNG